MFGNHALAVSNTGSLAYLSCARGANLYWCEATGQLEPTMNGQHVPLLHIVATAFCADYNVLTVPTWREGSLGRGAADLQLRDVGPRGVVGPPREPLLYPAEVDPDHVPDAMAGGWVVGGVSQGLGTTLAAHSPEDTA